MIDARHELINIAIGQSQMTKLKKKKRNKQQFQFILNVCLTHYILLLLSISPCFQEIFLPVWSCI